MAPTIVSMVLYILGWTTFRKYDIYVRQEAIITIIIILFLILHYNNE